MATEILMPRLGLTMTVGIIVEWLKEEGDEIKKGEAIVEIESDKVVNEQVAPCDGILIKITASEGAEIEVSKPIGYIGYEGETISEESHGPINTTEVETAENPSIVPEKKYEKSRLKASPAAKKTALKYGITISDVPARPDRQRVEKDDVLNYIKNQKAEVEKLKGNDTPDIIKPMTSMRITIAKRMMESLSISAQLSMSCDVDITELTRIKESSSKRVLDEHGVKLTYNSILAKIVARAIKECPWINCSILENKIIYKKEINIGIAVAVDDGLFVPVIKNADHKKIGEIAHEINRLIKKCKENTIGIEELSGGTFTVSNLGMYGIDSFNSIINQPESAILSLGTIRKVPAVSDNEEIVVKKVMNMTLTYDHRSIDGAQAGRFLNQLKSIIEVP